MVLNMANPEAVFQKKVRATLKAHGIWHFTKEAKSLRGLPDIIGCYQGTFFGWELKKSASECRRKTGRIVLQRYILKLIKSAGGVGEFVCPENLDQKLHQLLESNPK
jgi:hypothetical protein